MVGLSGGVEVDEGLIEVEDQVVLVGGERRWQEGRSWHL
jgi:hypothetical protein